MSEELIHCVRLSDDGQTLISGHEVTGNDTGNDWQLNLTSSGVVRIWDATLSECIATFSSYGTEESKSTSPKTVGDHEKENLEAVNTCCLFNQGRFALTGGVEGRLMLWDVRGKRHLGTKPMAHRGFLTFSLSVSYDGRFALSGYTDGILKVWELSKATCIQMLVGHTSGVNSACFSLDGRFALSGSTDKTVRLWELGSGKCIQVLTGHEGPVTSLSMSADGRWALSASGDKCRLWDLESGECLQVFAEWGPVLFSPDASCAIIGKRVWQLDWELEDPPPHNWDGRAERHLMQFLTRQTPLGPLPPSGIPNEKEIESALTRSGSPVWNEKDFARLLAILGCAGYGWISTDNVRRKLDELGSNWTGNKWHDF